MVDLMLTPIPMVAAVIVFSALSLGQVRTRLWAKTGCFIAVVLFVANITALCVSLSQMSRAGRQRAGQTEETSANNTVVEDTLAPRRGSVSTP
jgi:hypothetical protein